MCHHWGTSPGTLAELVRRDVFTRLFVADVIVDSSAFVQFQESPAMLADRGDDPLRTTLKRCAEESENNKLSYGGEGAKRVSVE